MAANHRRVPLTLGTLRASMRGRGYLAACSACYRHHALRFRLAVLHDARTMASTRGRAGVSSVPCGHGLAPPPTTAPG